MARVRSRNTGLELLFRRALWKLGLRYRLNAKLPGAPDVAFMTERLAVFVDGCFWHACPDHYRAPATNVEFWRAKHDRNSKRDRHVNRCLELEGWTVLRIWEHEIKQDKNKATDRVVRSLKSASKRKEQLERQAIIGIRKAVRNGNLGERFRPHEINALLKITWADGFLAKHRVGNPAGLSELFIRIGKGFYRLAK